MKKIYGLAAMSALLSLASCSTEDPVINSADNETSGEDQYIAVRIAMPTATRALTESFEYGTTPENTINNATFLLFDSNGNYVGQPTITITNSDFTHDSSTEDGTAAELTNAVLVINGATSLKSNRLLVVLNDNNSIATTDATLTANNATITDVRRMVVGLATVTNETTGFVMTNSPYLADGRLVTGARLTGHIYTTAAEAQADPMTVYVERVTSKVRYTEPEAGMVISPESITFNSVANATDPDDNGETQLTLTPTINGIYLYNRINQSFLSKKAQATWDASVYDADNYRINWADIPEKETDNVTTDTQWNNASWTTLAGSNYAYKSKVAKSFYTLENTDQEHKTGMIIAATLKNEDDEAVDFVKFAGLYMTPERYINRIVSNVNEKGYRKSLNGEDQLFTAADFAFATQTQHTNAVNASTIHAYKTFLVCSPATGSGTVAADKLAEINNMLKEALYTCQYWNQGKCYYFVEIENSAVEDFQYGVIRNNVYEIEIQGIRGLGTPVPHPGEEITPEKPSDSDETRYVAAKISVNSWRVVKQPVTFE